MLIVVEGLDRAGKSELLVSLAKEIEAKTGRRVVTTREPGGTKLGEQLRSLIKGSARPTDENVPKIADMLMFFAARTHLMQNVVLPALQEDAIVLMDRFFLSTLVYQATTPELRAVADSLLENSGLIILPDLTIYLDLKKETYLERLGVAEDHLEESLTAEFDLYRKRYLELLDESAEKPCSHEVLKLKAENSRNDNLNAAMVEILRMLKGD